MRTVCKNCGSSLKTAELCNDCSRLVMLDKHLQLSEMGEAIMSLEDAIEMDEEILPIIGLERVHKDDNALPFQMVGIVQTSTDVRAVFAYNRNLSSHKDEDRTAYITLSEEQISGVHAWLKPRLEQRSRKIDRVVVTRHKGLVALLIKRGIIAEGTPVIDHATVDTVRGKHVIGVLPLSLACHAASVTEIVMNLPLELRGKDLSLEDCEKYAGEAITYVIRRV